MTDNLDIVMMVAGLFGLMLGLVTGMKKRGNLKGEFTLMADLRRMHTLIMQGESYGNQIE